MKTATSRKAFVACRELYSDRETVTCMYDVSYEFVGLLIITDDKEIETDF